ncbi:MAG: aromatic ring-hydroxylating dioxygenase subunit alpha, partial [Chloroflexi bacterium]|nr:aromatic ring-hydroxylating dioxygenase subunit alpha [Chloroflexota bacterium]
MLTREENEIIVHTGPGTPMGEVMRRYWLPVLLSWELEEPDCTPVRVKLVGEELIAFKDTDGNIGLVDNYCPH